MIHYYMALLLITDLIYTLFLPLSHFSINFMYGNDYSIIIYRGFDKSTSSFVLIGFIII